MGIGNNNYLSARAGAERRNINENDRAVFGG